MAKSYKVKAGDTLSKISKEMLGDASRWREILEANKDKIKDPNTISPGLELTIPTGEDEAAAKSPKHQMK